MKTDLIAKNVWYILQHPRMHLTRLIPN